MLTAVQSAMGIALVSTWSPTLLPVVARLAVEATVYTAQPFNVKTMGMINHFMLALYALIGLLSTAREDRL